MDISNDILDAFLALTGFSMFFIFAVIGTLMSSSNPDSHLYIDFNPAEDFFIIFGLMALKFIFMFLFLMQSFKFRQSRNLDKHYGELLVTTDKLIFYSFLFLPIEGIMIYYNIKYFETSIAFYIFLTLLFGVSLVILIFYTAIRIRKDYKEELAEK